MLRQGLPSGDEEVSALRERLARLGEASLRINESLEFDAVLQGVLDSARDLTQGPIRGDHPPGRSRGQAEDVLSSGLTLEEAERLWKVPDAAWFFERLGRIPGPLRVPDLSGYLASQGLSEPGLPVPAGPVPGGSRPSPGPERGHRLPGKRGVRPGVRARMTRRRW